MEIELSHELPTVGGESITLHLRNTMRQDIRYAAMRAKFAKGQLDEGLREDFCYLWARVVKVSGAKLQPINETASMDAFEKVYYGLAELVQHTDFIQAANRIVEMKSNHNATEKPDEALEPTEADDPNS